MQTLLFLACVRLTLLVYNACRTRLRGWLMAYGRDQSFTDLLRELHWFRVRQRIIYKLKLYVYKALNDMDPSYLSAMTHLQNTDAAEYMQRLRSSSDQTRLIVSSFFKRACDMSFTNRCSLPLEWTYCCSFCSPCLCLSRSWKTHLFP